MLTDSNEAAAKELAGQLITALIIYEAHWYDTPQGRVHGYLENAVTNRIVPMIQKVLDNQVGWIAVKDQLPPRGHKVLLYDRSIGPVVGTLEYRDETETYWETYGGHTFTGPIGVNKNNPVTHWQPLPTPKPQNPKTPIIYL